MRCTPSKRGSLAPQKKYVKTKIITNILQKANKFKKKIAPTRAGFEPAPPKRIDSNMYSSLSH